MADKSFQIPPSERREPKRFEPPPWELDAFEELERKRQETEAELESVPVVEEAPAGPAAEEPKGAAAEAQAGATDSEEGDTGADAARQTPPGPGIEEKRVAAMLAELAAEEPKEDRAVSTVTMAVAVVVFALGSMMVMWGMAGFVAARGSGMQATAAASVLFLFGAGFVGGGIYLAVKSLQKRGVL